MPQMSKILKLPSNYKKANQNKLFALKLSQSLTFGGDKSKNQEKKIPFSCVVWIVKSEIENVGIFSCLCKFVLIFNDLHMLFKTLFQNLSHIKVY